MQILYLENHEIFARNVTRLFLAEHDVVVVPSLAAASCALALGDFDLVLSDYDVDDGKGDAFVLECRTAYPEMPIIAASSHDEGNQALMRAGANAVCEKLRFSKIGEIIRQLVNQAD